MCRETTEEDSTRTRTDETRGVGSGVVYGGIRAFTIGRARTFTISEADATELFTIDRSDVRVMDRSENVFIAVLVCL